MVVPMTDFLRGVRERSLVVPVESWFCQMAGIWTWSTVVVVLAVEMPEPGQEGWDRRLAV